MTAMRGTFNLGTNSIELYFGEHLVDSWPMPTDHYPKWKVDAFIAARFHDLFWHVEQNLVGDGGVL